MATQYKVYYTMDGESKPYISWCTKSDMGSTISDLLHKGYKVVGGVLRTLNG